MAVSPKGMGYAGRMGCGVWTGQIRCTPERLEWKRRHKQPTWVPAKCGACGVPVKVIGDSQRHANGLGGMAGESN